MQKENSKYNSLAEWRKASPSVYYAAYKKGLIDKICKEFGWDKKKPDGYWTIETCKESALKYNTRNDWKKSIDRSGYDAAIRNGWMEECCKHMKRVFKPVGHWTLENCKEDALKYKTRLEWKKKHGHVYHIARENGWLEVCCSHMKQIAYPKGYWTLEKCKEDALKYFTKAEWRASSSGYDAAVKNEWYEECCKHMKSGYANRKV